MASISRQRALTGKTLRNAAEPQRGRRPAQTSAADSPTDKTAGHCGSTDNITPRRHDELPARGRDETKTAPPLEESSTANVISSQNKNQTPLVGTCSQEKLGLTSGEQDPGPKLPIADHGDIIQRGFCATQAEASFLQSKPGSKHESPPDAPALTETALQMRAGRSARLSPSSKPTATLSLLQQHINTQPCSSHPPKTPN